MGHKKSGLLRVSGLSRFLQVLESTVPSVKEECPTANATLGRAADETAEGVEYVSTQREPQARNEILTVDGKSSDDSSAPERSSTEPPTKKRRLVKPIVPIDVHSIVSHFTDASQVPEHLQKYFAQRTRLFSRYAEGCLLDDEGWYSVTPEAIADRIAERCRCGTVLDAFCGVGGNAIAFAKTCERVIALDISPTRLALARHNAEIYGVADRIEFILGDFLSFARTTRIGSPASKSSLFPDEPTRTIDVVFLSPPWGGPSYLSGTVPTTAPQPDPGEDSEERHPEFGLDGVAPVHGRELFALARRLTRNVAYYLPRNTRLEDIAALLDDDSGATPATAGQKRRCSESEQIEVEEEWMGNKLKALTCYFGGLAEGQQELW